MGILSDFTKKIRNAIYVKDVRDAIADGLETVEALEEKNLETYNNMVIGAGESNAEIVDARLDNNTGTRYEKVGKRLDKISSEIDEIGKYISTLEINVLCPPNVLYNGKKLEPLTTDGTDQLEKYTRIINYIRENLKWVRGATVYFPSGDYYFSEFPLYSYINVRGNGKRNTILHALEQGENATAFIYLKSSPVQMMEFRDLTIRGVENNIEELKNPNQSGLSIVAGGSNSVNNNTGCWRCTFKNLEITGFAKNQIESIVNVDYNTGANQFLRFEDIEAQKMSTVDSRAFYGGANQTIHIRCHYGANDANYIGTCVETNGSMVMEDVSIVGSEYGLVVNSGTISLVHPWFEHTAYAITNKGSGTITSLGGHFANAANGGGTGYICKQINQDGSIAMYNPYVVGKIDRYFDEGITSNSGILWSTINYRQFKSENVSKRTKQLTIEEGVAPFLSNKQIILVNSDSVLSVIGNSYPSGCPLTFIALGKFTINPGGDISLRKAITLSTGDTITFIKKDLATNNDVLWSIVSIFRQEIVENLDS